MLYRYWHDIVMVFPVKSVKLCIQMLAFCNQCWVVWVTESLNSVGTDLGEVQR